MAGSRKLTTEQVEAYEKVTGKSWPRDPTAVDCAKARAALATIKGLMNAKPACEKHGLKPQFGCQKCVQNRRAWLCVCGRWMDAWVKYCLVCGKAKAKGEVKPKGGAIAKKSNGFPIRGGKISNRFWSTRGQ